MTPVKRLIDATLHTGEVSYLIGEGRTGVPYPVLEDVLDGRFKECVATTPFEGPASLFYRIYEPTSAMRLLATDTFPAYKGRADKPVTRDSSVWRHVQMVHRELFSGAAPPRQRAAEMLPVIARELAKEAGETVSPLSLAAAAVAYQETGVVALANNLAASVIPASLLVMAGVPRERVACFGVYYQNPLQYRTLETGWVGGFYVPAPNHVFFGVYVGGHWVPVDFTRQPRESGDNLPSQPTSYLRDPNFGQREDDGAAKIADYAHPYTMVFPPPPASGQHGLSPVLKHVPLL